MSSVFTVVSYRSAPDPAALSAYAERAGPAIAAAGGRFIARGAPLATFEKGLDERLAIIVWPNLEAAQAGYNSADYQAALACLGAAAERDIRIVQGLDAPAA